MERDPRPPWTRQLHFPGVAASEVRMDSLMGEIAAAEVLQTLPIGACPFRCLGGSP